MKVFMVQFSADVIQNILITELSNLYNQLKYTEKVKNQTSSANKQLSKHVQQAYSLLKSRNQQFPRIKHIRSHNNSELATISERYNQQSVLSNYINRSSRNKMNKNLNQSDLRRYSDTLQLDSQVFRQQTKKSLQTSRERQKKPLYNELQKIKGKDHYVPSSVKLYHEPRKYNVRNRLPQYHLAKLI